ncbi:membrane protein [Porphyromonadaceae bacterium COT-184 OH4590]|nr:membrane protein [Porphyromonadaceae bacterium COT-184 OH4590]MDO4725991.1 EamA family transporter [Porphyromonadaceae bacterium]
MKYLYVFGTLFFTVYGQIILKWRIGRLGWQPNSESIVAAVVGYIKFLFDPLIFSGFLSAFVASVFWMLAMTKFEITHAYPFMSLAPALVFVLGVWLLGETFTWGKVIGLVLIMIGIIVTVKF